MKKKTILTILSFIMVAMISVMGTLAYLTDSESVTNTFTVGQVDIVLDEADVDENGEIIEGSDRVKENKYHLIPGQNYTKDPTITVQANSEDSYIRMIMTIHNANAVQAIIDKYQLGDFSAFIDGWDETVWQYKDFSEDKTANTISFEFRYKETVSTGSAAVKLPALFTTLKVPKNVNGTELKALYDPDGNENYDDGFKMVIVGHAIQKAGFADADSAWAAFEEQTRTMAQP